MLDLILKNAVVYDGTGAPPFHGNIGIAQGKIAVLSQQPIAEEAKEIVDLGGLAAAPGFIDFHSHSDTTFLPDSRCQSKLFQGITSEVTGQCGYTVYPCKPEKLELMKEFSSVSSKWDSYVSTSMAQFIEKAKSENRQMATNQLPMVGHGALRAGVMGFEGRKATAEELADMAALLDKEMADGAWGMTLGLGYAPGVFADQEELNAMGEVIAKYDGIIASHMRNQGAEIIAALEEMYEINRKTGAKVHISHLKSSGKEQWGWAPKIWEYIKQAQKNGIAVTADMYPYTAAATGITNILPKWTLEGGVAAAAARLASDQRGQILAELDHRFAEKEDGEAIYVVTTYGLCPEADGKNIYEMSQIWNCTMSEAAARLMVETKGSADCIFFCMSEEDVLYFLRQEVTIGTDGCGMPLSKEENEGRPHPRHFATFPRFFRLVREEKLCTLEHAVYRATGLPAQIIGLQDRGLLKEGMVADITVFDPDTIADKATYENPFQKAEGIEYVLLAGEFAIHNGEQTEKRLGQFLLKNR